MDTNIGSEAEPDVRCRLVAREFKKESGGDREDLFVATPPVEAERMVFSRAVTVRRRGVKSARKIMFIDARNAHSNPPCEQEVYIKLPDEAGEGPGVCGKLKYCMYGCRPAAQA